MSKKSFIGGLDDLLSKTVGEKQIKENTDRNDENSSIRTTIIISAKTYEIIKSIAYWERKPIKDIIESGFAVIIERYSKEEIDKMVESFSKQK